MDEDLVWEDDLKRLHTMPKKEATEENNGCFPSVIKLLDQYGEFSENLPGFAKSFEDWLGTFAGGFLNSFANWLRAGRSNPNHPLPLIGHPKNRPQTDVIDVSPRQDTISEHDIPTKPIVSGKRRPIPLPRRRDTK